MWKVAVTSVAAICGLVVTVVAKPSSAVSRSAPRPVTVSMFGGQPAALNVKTNWFTRYAERTFGLKFNFDIVPQADVPTKQPLLLASGDYPDVIWSGTITQADALKYGTEGVFVPLNGLIKKYAPNVWKAVQDVPGYRQDAMAPNGKIYALPAYNYCFQCALSYKFWIDIADLNRYHLSMPRTTSQFERVLAIFKAHGIVPLTGSSATSGGYNEDVITFLMNAFIPFNGMTGNFLDVRSGHVVFVPEQPAWRQGLAYLHALYQQGLFSKVALTQQATQVEQLISKQEVGVVPNGAIGTAITDYGASDSHYQDWLGVPALRGPKGVDSAAFEGGVSGLVFAITNKATKIQEIRVMKLLNFMYTAKGAQMEDFGPAGKYWTVAKKGQKGLVAQQALFNTNHNAFYSGNAEQNAGWNQWGPINQSEPWRNLNYTPGPFTPLGSTALYQLATAVDMAGHQAKEQYPAAVWVPLSGLESFTTEQTNIGSYVTQWTDEFITGQKSLTSQWSAYRQGLHNLDLTSYLKTSQKVMVKPENGLAKPFLTPPGDIKYLLCAGPVPALTKTYLTESGVPATDFSCSQ